MSEAPIPPCPGCGLVRAPAEGAQHDYIGASPGCWALFTEVMAREYNDPARWPVHALSIDAYAVQHPGTPSRRSSRSVGVHLIALALVLERGVPLEQAARIRTAAAERLGSGMAWLSPPDTTTGLSIADVAATDNAEAHVAVVRSWAREMWDRWHPHHATVDRWVDWLYAASPPSLRT